MDPHPAPVAQAEDVIPVASARDLGRLLATHRRAAGLTQEDVADLLGVHRRYVCRIEAGETGRYATRVFALLDVLGVRLTAPAPEVVA